VAVLHNEVAPQIEVVLHTGVVLHIKAVHLHSDFAFSLLPHTQVQFLDDTCH